MYLQISMMIIKGLINQNIIIFGIQKDQGKKLE